MATRFHFRRERVSVDAITVDAGTQIRVAINEQVVSDYAEQMTDGVEFPAIVLFHDGVRYYLADGFHRTLAAKRNKFRDIEADVDTGTRADALWFALGANKENGQRLTDADKRHAVLMAVTAFMNDKSQHEIARQIGCSQGFVSQVISRNNVGRPERVPGKDGNTYPSSVGASQSIKERAAILLREGKTVDEVRAEVGIGREAAYQIRREIGMGGVDKSRDAIQERRKQISKMAAEGHTSRQIAAAIGIDERTVPVIARAEGIDIQADKVVGKTRRHDSNRIVSQIVADAENLTAGVELVEFAALDRLQATNWVTSLTESRNKLNAFIRRLTKETQHGEAA